MSVVISGMKPYADNESVMSAGNGSKISEEVVAERASVYRDWSRVVLNQIEYVMVLSSGGRATNISLAMYWLLMSV